MSSKQKRSAIWLYFNVVSEGQAKCTSRCTLCKNIYSFKGGTTSNLKKHIKTRHPTVEIDEATTAKLPSVTVERSSSAVAQQGK